MRRQPGIRHQQGAVLLVALIFLVVLTVAGVTAMRFATIEERMASNVQFRNQAFQIAQSELRYQLLEFMPQSNRNPLLAALNRGAEDPTNPIMKILPDSTLRPEDLAVKMQKHIKLSQARSTRNTDARDGGCTDDKNQGSSLGNGYTFGFRCLEFELSTLAALDDSCAPEYKCGANSTQAMGISFITN